MNAETQKPEKDIFRKLLQGLSEKDHLEYLGKMYPYYELESPPDPIPVYVRKDLCVKDAVFNPEDDESFLRGGYPVPYISLGIGNLFDENSWNSEEYSGLTLEEKLFLIESICVHETAHYLHWSTLHLKFPDKYPTPSNFGGHLGKDIIEFIGELGTQTFFEKEQRLRKYLDLMRRTEIIGGDIAEIVSKVPSPKRNLLKKVSSLGDRSIIQKHIPHEIGQKLREEYPTVVSGSKIIRQIPYDLY